MDERMHKAAFLGPKGENADELERLLLEVLRDHVFWRRNFHPSDQRLIDERDKRSPEYDEMMARMRDKLFQILAELKRAAPLYSTRQIAHIVSDPTLPALVGYFAGLLYNQNNVVAEVSPETVREEREYLKALARMVGYPDFLPETIPAGAREERTPFSWGHLCSGGTVANLESLWMARNVRLYPLAVRLLAAQESDFEYLSEWTVETATGDERPMGALSTFELSNLPIGTITDLHLRIRSAMEEADRATAQAFQDAIPSVRKAGLASFLLRYNNAFPDDRARLPKVFISQAAHYCWKKNMDLVGLGADALETVPVDEHIRLDVDALAERIRACAADNVPVLGVVSICGTTEEGAIDPLHKVEAFRDTAAAEGITFWHHCDAAFGGYFASMLPHTEDGAFAAPDAADDALVGPDGLISAEAYRGIAALPHTDSIVIDPHKFGYVPYPAGAILVRDYHVRDAISYAAPYLADDDRAGFGGFLGQWTLEGSRPGAAAVSCYLSQEMVPLTEDGHGQFMRNCIGANKALVGALDDHFARDETWITLRPFAEPDTVGYCFVLAPREGFESVEELNAFTNRIWRRMTVDGREDINQYDFLMSKTEIEVDAYRHVLEGMLPADQLDAAVRNDASLTLLRTCLMNPFLQDWNALDPPFTEQFVDYLHDVALDEYLDHVLPTSPQQDGVPLKVLVVEQASQLPDSLARQLQFEDYAAFLDVKGLTPEQALAADALPSAMEKALLHADPSAPDASLRVAQKILADSALQPADLIVIADAIPEPLRAGLEQQGLPPSNVIAESRPRKRFKRLLTRLYAHARPTPVY